MEKEKIHKNLLLHQIILNGDKSSFLEIIPSFEEFLPENILSLDSSKNLIWTKFPKLPESLKIQGGKIIIDTSLNFNFNVIEKGKIKGTNIYYKDDRIGVGRSPLKNYKFDIAVPKNTLMTAFHVGDGEYGFSMGNGTFQGFLPEIIGMGSDENQAGLYFLGRAGNEEESEIPLIIIDGRSRRNGFLKNRPIFGVTSGDYNKYKLLIDQDGKVGIGRRPKIYKLEIEGSIQVDDVIINKLSFKSLIDIIKNHQEEIDELKDIIKLLQEQK